MNNHPIPSTYEMLERTKRPQAASRFGWIENYFLAGLLILFSIAVTVWVLAINKQISKETATPILLIIVLVMVCIMAVWSGLHIFEAYKACKAGYRPMAERIDAAIVNERAIIDELTKCDPQELRERSKHLELEAKVLARRAGLATVTGAIAVALVNLLDTAAKASIWSDQPFMKLIVYASALGMFIGALLLVVLVGKLERIAGLFALAADRSKG